MTKTLRLLLLAPLIGAGTAHAAMGAEPAQPAGPYHLFNPVPDDKMREMTTERPSRADSPFTVDAGHLQIETALLEYDHDHETETTAYLAESGTNFRLGLTERSEIQIVVDVYEEQRVTDASGNRRTQRGFGDVTLRAKYNLWGNDGKDTALAVLPYLRLPTSSHHMEGSSVEGGLALPFNASLREGTDLGLQTSLSWIEDEDESGTSPAFANSASLTQEVTDDLSAYGEFFTLRTTDNAPAWYNSLDFGLIYSLTDNWQLDMGVNLGVTRAADDIDAFLGTSYRF